MITMPPILKTSAEERTIASLRDHVLAGVSLPGAKITEQALANDLQISRATVRVALHRLAAEGLVVQRPYAGWQIASFEPRDVWELYTLRAPLEALAARLAAKASLPRRRDVSLSFDELVTACAKGDQASIAERDFALHRSIVAAAGHARLLWQYGLIEQQIRLFISATNALVSDEAEIVSQHRPFVEAIVAGKATTAAKLISAHVGDEGRKLEELARQWKRPPPAR